jgi:Ser/Thr protein kinase RdoA (MazF antagonist)
VIEGIDVSRDVTLVLTDGADVIGALPAFQVPTPWWADVAVVIEAAEQLTGRRVSILRLLTASASSSTMGGSVTYLAEIDRPPEMRLYAWAGPDPLAPGRHRVWWAEPGALADAIAWATAALAGSGVEVVRARQQRTWNLSLLVWLETTGGPVWLKAVPRFLADQGFVLARLGILEAATGLLPTVLAHDPSRSMVLLADIPGVDLWDASVPDVIALGERLVELHREGRQRGLPELVADRVADRTGPALEAELSALLEDGVPDEPLDPALRVRVARLRDNLPALLAPLDVLPDVVVHGDPHPGNWRARPGGQRVLLDWGDTAVASPLGDVGPLLARLPTEEVATARRSLARTMATAFGVEDLSAAMTALPLLTEVTGAVVYARFCRNIESDELVYHRDDVIECLDRAATLADARYSAG